MTARNRKSGFTLVEILIVVVILGILAAIVIPQFSSASESAKASSLKSTLQTIRSQLELYQVQHNGKYPPAMTTTAGEPTWRHMTEAHTWTPDENDATADGTFAWKSDDPANSKSGPYMQKFPKNPFAGGATDPAAHWNYNEETGQIKAMVNMLTEQQIDLLSLDDTDDFATTADEE